MPTPDVPRARGFLVGLAHGQEAPTELPARLGATGPGLRLTPLFEAPPSAPRPGFGAVAAPRRSWFLASPATESDQASFEPLHPWDVAHRLVTEGMGLAGAPQPEIVEPDLEQSWVWAPDPRRAIGAAPAEPVPCDRFDPQKGAPFARGDGYAWHLGEAYSGLRAAREAAEAAGASVKIVHLDTGFDPQHAARPEEIGLNEARNFVDEDRPNDATDRTAGGGLLRNRGHGTGTLGILAGRRPQGNVLPPEAAGGYLGGAPRETVVPVRIADSVVHFWTSNVARGIAYAREIPARFGRVIAACGAMADKTPYFNRGDLRGPSGCRYHRP